MAILADCRLYPIESLDGISVGQGELTAAGTIAGDRAYAPFADGEAVFGCE